jgi:putative PIN family toxin of toxin-antitoxin system
MAALRVVLDTNVLVSGLAYPGSIPGRIVSLWRQGGLDVVLSHVILNEVKRVLPRLSRIRLTAPELQDLVDSLLFLADMVEPDGEKEECLRDAADQEVLATFRVSEADYLITGDNDLLELQGKYPVVSPAEFWARHG